MGGITYKLFLSGKGMLQAINHRIEREGQGIQLVFAGAQGDSQVQGIFADFFNFIIDGCQWLQNPAGQKVTQHKNKDTCCENSNNKTSEQLMEFQIQEQQGFGNQNSVLVL